MKPSLVGMLVVGLLLRSSSPLCADGMLSVEQLGAAGDVALRAHGPSSQGHFKLVFSRRAGGISSWYDLDRDPGEHHNLAGHGELPQAALLMHVLRPIGVRSGDALYSAPAETITVLEANDVRVRLRLEGGYSTAEAAERFRPESPPRGLLKGPGGRDPETRFVTTYTIYPTGQLYVCHAVRRAATTVVVGQSEWVLATAPSSQFTAVGSVALAQPGAPSDFLLHTGSGPPYSGDALLVPDRRALVVGSWQERFVVGPERRGATRSSLEVQPPGFVIGAQGARWCGLLQIEPDWMDRRYLATAAAEAYQSPPLPRIEAGWGEVMRGREGDDNVDGFAEEEGCYLLRASPRGLQMKFDLSELVLISPVFRIGEWQGPPPATVILDGQELVRGRHFGAARGGVFALLVQLYRNLSGGTVELELPTGEAGRQ